MNEERPFQVPLPPPFPAPPAGAERDVLFFWQRAEDEPEGTTAREAEDLMLRRVPAATAKRFRQAAGGRGLTHAQYLAALVELHDAMRGLADEAGEERVRAELERLGLTTVSV
jgi:hypothetical protein